LKWNQVVFLHKGKQFWESAEINLSNPKGFLAKFLSGVSDSKLNFKLTLLHSSFDGTKFLTWPKHGALDFEPVGLVGVVAVQVSESLLSLYERMWLPLESDSLWASVFFFSWNFASSKKCCLI